MNQGVGVGRAAEVKEGDWGAEQGIGDQNNTWRQSICSQEMQAKKEAEMVQKIIEKVRN